MFMGKNILIIGNGFDLYHKLPTRYTDFLTFSNEWDTFKDKYEYYCNSINSKIEQSDYDPTAQFTVPLGSYGQLTNESIIAFADHAYCFDTSHIQYLNEHLNSNIWIQYFRTTNYQKEGWIDFEKEVENILVYVEKYYNEILPNYAGKIVSSYIHPDEHNILNIITAHASTPYKSLHHSLLNPHDIFPQDLAKQKSALLDSLKQELDILNKCLGIYLAEFVCRLKCLKYSEQIRELSDVYLLNFNYTYTYKTVYGGIKLAEIHHIHGCLGEENLVLGISDTFTDSLDYVYFQKYFQRIQKRTGNSYRHWLNQTTSSLKDTSSIVYIMGHSLDMTDKGMLQYFFFSPYIEQIIIFYHNQSSYENEIINLVRMFGQDYIIEQTGIERIKFKKLEAAVDGSLR